MISKTTRSFLAASAGMYVLVTGSTFAATPQAKTQTPAVVSNTLIDASNPEAILEIARNYGDARLITNKNNDPRIKMKTKNYNWWIEFYGCKDGINCGSIQLYYGFNSEIKPSLSRINEWNSNNRWTAAYQDKDQDPNITQDIYLRSGVSRENFTASIARWQSIMDDFYEFMTRK